MARVLVAGATGGIGRRVASLLQADNHTVRVLSRSAKRARACLADDIEIHEGDVRDPDSLVGVARDVEFVISAFGTRTYFGRNGGAAVDATGTQNLVAAVAGESIGQFVLLSAFGLDRSSIFLSAFSLMFNRYYVWKVFVLLACSIVPHADGPPSTNQSRWHCCV